MAVMRLRAELFVDDLDASIRFYTEVLGFEVVRRNDGYASVQRGLVVFGLGPVDKLPESGTGPGFTRQRLARDKGAGVEIVLELDDVRQVASLHERCRALVPIVEELQDRPWGLRDFRILDPDGYYLRITHGDAATDRS
jgi:catechol 2,3-dioxygenase-like lactoylglutathione lyase family enzyme